MCLLALLCSLPLTRSLRSLITDDHAAAARLTGWLHGGRALIQFFSMPLLGAVSDVRGRKVRPPLPPSFPLREPLLLLPPL
jgi:hypothetical protein